MCVAYEEASEASCRKNLGFFISNTLEDKVPAKTMMMIFTLCVSLAGGGVGCGDNNNKI
jgi:hypothetical protein